MREIRYFILTMILFISSCATPHPIKKEATSPAITEVIANTAMPTLSKPLPTSSPTSTVERVSIQEPILVTKYVFPYDYLTINDLYFIDENNGWAVGRLVWYEPSVSTLACCKLKIFNTKDGGANWNEVERGITSGVLNSITFTDSMIGYTVGQESLFDASTIILKTIDGGKTWKRVDRKQASGVLNYVMVTESNRIWIAGRDFNDSQSLILRSTDGLNWKTQDHPSQIGAELTTIFFSSEKVGYAIGFVGHDSPDPYIIKTVDGGDSWVELPVPYTTGRVLDMVFLDDVTGYVIGHHGDTGLIAITNDGGESWTMKNLQSGLWLNWFSESNNRLIIFGNCTDTDTCNNLIGLFNGKDLFPFQTLTFPDETFTAVGNSMNDGSIAFVTNTKPEAWDAKYETTFYEYSVP